MIEQRCKHLAGLCRNLAGRMKTIGPRNWIVVIVMLLVCARGWVEYDHRHTGDRGEIATAIGSIGFLYGTPRPDYSGSRVLYLRSSEAGVGVFACDVASEKRELLSEKSFTAYLDCVSPFSPSDALIAYVFDSIYPSGYCSICRANSGEEVARVEVPDWHVSEIVWLTPEKLICRGWAPGGAKFHFIEKKPDGRWGGWTPEMVVTNSSCLTALSKNTFAWVDVNGLCAMNIVSHSVTTLFKPQGSQISEFSCDRESGRFLVTCKEKNGYSLWSVKQSDDTQNDVTRMASDKNIQNAEWVNGGKGYAYLNQNKLVVKANAGEHSLRLDRDIVDRFVVSPDGRRMVFCGTVSNEPWAGLWEYDIPTETLTNIAPYSDHPSPNAVGVEPLRCALRTEAGWNLNYYIYWPAHFDRHKKYPLLIGSTPFLDPNALYQRSVHGPNWAEALASCGAYVVVVNRNSWFGGLDKCGAEVMDVYHHLLPDPTIDASEVYLFGASAETTYMSKLVEEQPELWRGALLLNPTGLPDLSALNPLKRLPNFFLSAGAEEGKSERFKKYQQEASGHGIDVEVQEIPETGHFLISMPAVCERTRAMVNFVFNNP